MSHWATKRKFTYIGAFFALLFFVLALPTFFSVYETPTCFDNKQNQEESGVDCGGPCNILCNAETLKPIVLWQRAFKVLPGIYNAVAYVENPNLNSGAKSVPYIFKFYDEKGVPIYEREGKADIPPNKIFPIFEGRIETDKRIPARVTFEFTEEALWKKDNLAPLDIRVNGQTLQDDKSFPRVVASLENKSAFPVYDLEVVALVYDANENAIAASKTVLDKLDKNSSGDVVFTWPKSLELGVGACEKPAEVVVTIDRSGSMNDDGSNPPEPLSSVKKAAISFVENLKEMDKVGVVSFATYVKEPIDGLLSSNLSEVKDIINSISIGTDGSQNTNIGEGIIKAADELVSPRHTEGTKQVIVLLTDGIPSHPQKNDNPNFPEEYSIEASLNARQKNIEIYIIGLGSKVNSQFLQSLASPGSYYQAFETGELSKIYKNISTGICKMGPTKIQIIPIVK